MLGKQGPVQAFMEKGEDFVVEHDLPALVAGMNKLAAERGGPQLSLEKITEIVEHRDSQVAHGYSKDAQCMLINNARSYVGEKYSRIAKPHRLLDPLHGPLVAVRMNIVSAPVSSHFSSLDSFVQLLAHSQNSWRHPDRSSLTCPPKF